MNRVIFASLAVNRGASPRISAQVRDFPNLLSEINFYPGSGGFSAEWWQRHELAEENRLARRHQFSAVRLPPIERLSVRRKKCRIFLKILSQRTAQSMPSCASSRPHSMWSSNYRDSSTSDGIARRSTSLRRRPLNPSPVPSIRPSAKSRSTIDSAYMSAHGSGRAK